MFQTYSSTTNFNIVVLCDCDYVGLWQLVTSGTVYKSTEHDGGVRDSTVHDSGEYRSTAHDSIAYEYFSNWLAFLTS
jgi:hypothetical protein